MMPADKAPFLSIGIATYDRNELLRETLSSILAQPFADFEILVGNNFTAQPLSAEVLRISDDRIRYINHSQNLGQHGNMTSLLAEAKGEYFTWLNDDDLYREPFLEAIRAALRTYPDAPCVFTTYDLFHQLSDVPPVHLDPALISRPEPAALLEGYLTRQIPLIGCYAVFERQFLLGIGGMPKLGEGPLLYADNFLTVNAISRGKCALVNVPLVLFRAHDGSVSNRSQEVSLYARLQRAMFDRCEEPLNSPALRKGAARYRYLLGRWFLDDAMAVALRAKQLRGEDLYAYAALVLYLVRRMFPYSLALLWVFVKRLLRITASRHFTK